MRGREPTPEHSERREGHQEGPHRLRVSAHCLM
jgi:hypothetical protein